MTQKVKTGEGYCMGHGEWYTSEPDVITPKVCPLCLKERTKDVSPTSNDAALSSDYYINPTTYVSTP